jgi:diguanylate cyclase (GGDEF)-like protein
MRNGVNFPGLEAASSGRRTIAVLVTGALAVILVALATAIAFDQMGSAGRRTRALIDADFSERSAYGALLYRELGVSCALTTGERGCLAADGDDRASYVANRARLLDDDDPAVAGSLRAFARRGDALDAILDRQVTAIRSGRLAATRAGAPTVLAAFVAMRAHERRMGKTFATALDSYRASNRAATATAEALTGILAVVLLLAGAGGAMLVAQTRREAGLARSDPLTSLPNRRAFAEQLDGALERRRPEELLGLLYLDLDGFKAVNDRFGHAAGDVVLVRASRRISRSVREDDLAARLGGDEFGVVLGAIESPDEAEFIAERVTVALQPPFVVEGQEMYVGDSVGIAIAPRDGTDGVTLLAAADAAMYRTKATHHRATP